MNFTQNQDVVDFIRPQISKNQEEVWIIALDSQLKLLSHQLLFRGTVDHCLFHQRDLFHFLFKVNANQCILIHTHLSDNCFPSQEDLLMTKKLVASSQIFEISLIDHLILSLTGFYSFRKDGLLEKYYRNKNYLRNFKND